MRRGIEPPQSPKGGSCLVFGRCACLGLFVWGCLFGVWGLRFGVWGLRFGVWGLGFGVWQYPAYPAYQAYQALSNLSSSSSLSSLSSIQYPVSKEPITPSRALRETFCITPTEFYSLIRISLRKMSPLWGCEKFVHSWLNYSTAEKEEKEFTRRYLEGYVCCLLLSSLSSFI